MNLFDRPNCPYLLEDNACNFDYVPCDQIDKDKCSIYHDLDIANANKRFAEHMKNSEKLRDNLMKIGIKADMDKKTGELTINMECLEDKFK